MKSAYLIAVCLVMVVLLPALSIPIFGEDLDKGVVKVSLSANPEDCAEKLIGSGEYPAGSVVEIYVKPNVNCVFKKWIIEGLPIKEAAANPLTFTVYSNVTAVAVFERLYYSEGGKVIPRVAIFFRANASIPLPEPMVVRPGEAVKVDFPEVWDEGDYRFIFLYAEDTEGRRYEKATAVIKANSTMTVIAYYTKLVRFGNEYYPVELMTPISFPEVAADEGVKLIPTGFRLLNKTYPLGEEVPLPLMDLVEPIYVKAYLVRITANEPVEVIVNGKRQPLGHTAYELWVKENESVSIIAPEETEKLELAKPALYGNATLSTSNIITITNIRGAANLILYYNVKPNAMFLDLAPPPLGRILMSIADIGTKLTHGWLTGFSALAIALSLMAAPPASTALVVRSFLSSRRLSIKAASIGTMESLIAARSAPAPSISSEEVSEALSASGMIDFSKLPIPNPTPNPSPRQLPTVSVKEGGSKGAAPQILTEKVKRKNVLKFKLMSNADIDLEDLASVELDEQLFRLLTREGVEPRYTGQLKFFGKISEGEELLIKLGQSNLISLKAEDLELAALMAESACDTLGYKSVRVDVVGIEEEPVAKLAKLLDSTYKADVIIIMGGGAKLASKLSSTALYLDKKLVHISNEVCAPPIIEIPTPTPLEYASIFLALAISQGKLGSIEMTFEQAIRVGESAKAFGGLKLLKEVLSLIPELGVEEALNEAMRKELSTAFSDEELRALQLSFTGNEVSLEELRDKYMTLIRQMRPGVDPWMAWTRFYKKLKRMEVIK